MAEIRGRFVLILDAMASWRTRQGARAAMKIPITDIKPDHWYNVKDTVLLYERAIANVNDGLTGLKVTGGRIMPTLKKYTNELDVFANPQQLLMAFNALFLSDNRGADAGHFKAIDMTATSAVLEDTSLHLPEFHLGVLEGAVRIFPGCSLISSETVERGSNKKVYKIKWRNKV
ncbi:MAG: hypothetical protein OEW09_07905 [Anaerolineae bacterium]|nr:hypothetical protein [Anaerolineae bacterium]